MTAVATLVVVLDGVVVELVVTTLGPVVARVVGADVEEVDDVDDTVGREAAVDFEWLRVQALPARSARPIPQAVAIDAERFIDLPRSAERPDAEVACLACIGLILSVLMKEWVITDG